MNKVFLTGRLTRDPEMRSLASGKNVTTFTVATNEFIGHGKEKAEYHPVVTWDRLAEIAGTYLGKGQQVAIEGRLQTRSWDDDRERQCRSPLDGIRLRAEVRSNAISAETVELRGTGGSGTGAGRATATTNGLVHMYDWDKSEGWALTSDEAKGALLEAIEKGRERRRYTATACRAETR